MKRIKKTAISFVLLLFTGFLPAQNYNEALYLVASETLTGEAEIEGAPSPISINATRTNTLRQEAVSARLLFTLDSGEDHIVFENRLFSAVLGFKIKTTPAPSVSQSLTIDQGSPEQVFVVDLLPLIQSGDLISPIEISDLVLTLTVTDGDGDALPPTDAAKVHYEANVRFKAMVEIEYRVDVRDAAGMISAPVVVGPVAAQDQQILFGRVVTFEWETNGLPFPNYQLQVLRLKNTDPAWANDPEQISTVVDWNNALIVETQSSKTEISLTMAEGTGFYVWRVRPIGTYFSGASSNSENFGQWSDAGLTMPLDKNNLTAPAVFYLEDPDEELNWIYNRIFTEGDGSDAGLRLSEGMTYADPLLRARQNQVYNSANGHKLISQTVIDYSGRPALQTLPVPVEGNLDAGYQIELVTPEGGSTPYSAKDFDTDEKLQDPTRIAETGAFAYYSDNNPDQRIPSAEGYAFQRSLFKTDGSGRVTEASGVGKRHALGDQSERGRTTRVYFATPSDEELIRIFGDEAPLGESVIKTITIDPNNVASVTYTSKEGNTIATALATTATDNLAELSTDPVPLTVRHTAGQNTLCGNDFVSSRRLAFLAPTGISLNYEANCNTPAEGCVGGDCAFMVRFYLTDLVNQLIYVSSSLACPDMVMSGMTWSNLETGALAPDLGTGPILNLEAGEYFITKVVSSGADADYMSDQINNFEAAYTTLIDAVGELMGQIDNAEDYQTFEETVDNLSIAFNTYDGSNTPASDAAYSQIISTLGLSDDAIVPPDFALGYDDGGDVANPAKLQIGAGECCSTEVPIDKPMGCIFCEEIEAARDAGDITEVSNLVGTYFIQPLKDRMIEQGFTPLNTFIADLAPGFTFESLNFMLTNMILSKYYTGKSILASGNLYKAMINPEGVLVYATMNADEELEIADGIGDLVQDPTNVPFNYVCEDLCNCWESAISMIVGFEYEDETNVMNTFNEKQGDEESENHFKDEELWDSGFLGFIGPLLLSSKMRNFNDSDEGKISAQKLRSKVTFSNLFMDCAGPQFFAILDENLTINYPGDIVDNIVLEYASLPVANGPDYNNFWDNSPEPGDFAGTINSSLALIAFGHNKVPVLVSEEPDKLFDPYRLRREWGFKYFNYNAFFDVGNSNATPNNQPLFLSHLNIELATCYDKPPCLTGVENLCYQRCEYDHLSWSADERLSFYRMIQNAPVNPDNQFNLDDDELFPEMECPTDEELMEAALEQLDGARSTCDSRRSEFRGKIIQMLQQACYIIVDCDPNAANYEVSYQQIDRMADAVVVKCKGQVNAIEDALTNDPDYGYPICNIETCIWLTNAGECEGKSEMVIEYFKPCDQTTLRQLSTWDFYPVIPPVPDCPNQAPESPVAGECTPNGVFNGDYSSVQVISN